MSKYFSSPAGLAFVPCFMLQMNSGGTCESYEIFNREVTCKSSSKKNITTFAQKLFWI